MWVRFKHVVLHGSQLPHRLADARHHPAYDEAIAHVPRPPVASELTWPNLALALIAAALWLAALAGAAARLAVLGSLWCVAAAGWQWADFAIKSRGRVRRQLYVVLDKRALRIASYARYTMTLWNPVRAFEITASRQLYQRCEVGEVGLAVFRGRHLRELLRLDASPRLRLRDARPLLHPAAAGLGSRFDERTGVS